MTKREELYEAFAGLDAAVTELHLTNDELVRTSERLMRCRLRLHSAFQGVLEFLDDLAVIAEGCDR
jgi:hypothetical protein